MLEKPQLLVFWFVLYFFLPNIPTVHTTMHSPNNPPVTDAAVIITLNDFVLGSLIDGLLAGVLTLVAVLVALFVLVAVLSIVMMSVAVVFVIGSLIHQSADCVSSKKKYYSLSHWEQTYICVAGQSRKRN